MNRSVLCGLFLVVVLASSGFAVVTVNTISKDGEFQAWQINKLTDPNTWTKTEKAVSTRPELRRLVIGDPNMGTGLQSAWIATSTGVYRIYKEPGNVRGLLTAFVIADDSYSLAIGDVKNIGVKDLIVGTLNQCVRAHWNSGPQTWGEAVVRYLDWTVMGVGIGDAGGIAGTNEITMAEGSKHKGWPQGTVIGVEWDGASFVAGTQYDTWNPAVAGLGGRDFNNDGKPDFVVGCEAYAQIWFCDTSAFPAAPSITSLAASGSLAMKTMALASGNVDGDGMVDLVWGFDGGYVIYSEWNGSAWVHSTIEANTGAGGAGQVQGLDTYDFDGDGLDEVVAVNVAGQLIIYKRNVGTGGFYKYAKDGGRQYVDVKVGDLGVCVPPEMDFNYDCKVDFKDFSAFAAQWMLNRL